MPRFEVEPAAAYGIKLQISKRVYVLCGVIHDWSDDLAVAILSNCRKAMAKNGRALIVEMIVPKTNFVLYAGQPQGDPIVSYGPFIGDSKRDIVRLYTEFQSGQFVSLRELVKAAV